MYSRYKTVHKVNEELQRRTSGIFCAVICVKMTNFSSLDVHALQFELKTFGLRESIQIEVYRI